MRIIPIPAWPVGVAMAVIVSLSLFRCPSFDICCIRLNVVDLMLFFLEAATPKTPRLRPDFRVKELSFGNDKDLFQNAFSPAFCVQPLIVPESKMHNSPVMRI